MTMHCPTLNLSHAVEDIKDLPASGWGQKELKREIELLEAEVRRDRFGEDIDSALAQMYFDYSASCSNRSPRRQYCSDSIEVLKGLDGVRIKRTISDYVDAALESVFGIEEEISFIQGVSNRLRIAYGGYLSLATIHKLGIATGLLRLRNKLRAACTEQLKLQTIATAACFRIPLFSYGPELSWFRHRLRLTLA